MADCRACGAPIIWCVDQETGEKVPLDAHGQEFRGEGRYRVVQYRSPHNTVAKVAPEYGLDAMTDHRSRCPRR